MARLVAPLGLTALLLCARLVAVPALSDPVAGSAPPSLHLAVPWLYLALAPLFTLWDGVSMLSMSRLRGFLFGLAALYVAGRVGRLLLTRYLHGTSTALRFSILKEIRTLAVTLVLLAAFLLGGALWHRPMLALAGAGPDDVVVDFHSHTNVSHDVRNTLMRGFDTEANRRWHSRAGFDATFITDHNVASRQSPVASRQPTTASTVLCPGIEVSAWRAHIVLLGDTAPVDQSRYNGSVGELLTLLATSDSTLGALSVASLPEYRRNHWGRLDQLVAAGSTASRSSMRLPRPTSCPERSETRSSRSPGPTTASWSASAIATGGEQPAWSGIWCTPQRVRPPTPALPCSGAFMPVSPPCESSSVTGFARTPGGPAGSPLSGWSGRHGVAWGGPCRRRGWSGYGSGLSAPGLQRDCPQARLWRAHDDRMGRLPTRPLRAGLQIGAIPSLRSLRAGSPGRGRSQTIEERCQLYPPLGPPTGWRGATG